jgi:anti-sigma-K factor RskA
MIRDHSEIEELLAVRSLGALDGDDVEALERALAEHGDCAECRELRVAFEETAGRLAFGLEPEPVDPRLADRILGNDDVVDIRDDAPAAARATRTGRGWRALVGVVAAFALVIGGYAAFGSRTTGIGGLDATQTVVRFEGAGNLAMAFVPGQPGAALIGSDMPDPGADGVFEIWMIEGEVPVSGGCVDAQDGSFAAWVDADVSGADLMAITIEPASCPGQPTSAPISTASLTVA